MGATIRALTFSRTCSAQAFPSDAPHYLVYWLSSFAGAALATLLWSLLNGDGIFASSEPGSTKSTGSTKAAWAKHAAAFASLNSDEDFLGILANYAADVQVQTKHTAILRTQT